MDKESTGMISWIDLSNDERIATLGHVAAQKGILPNAIEKDYWVSMVLRALFKQQYAYAFVFKGGTSLSKGWGLIERFSEDIDLAIDRKFLGFGEELNKSQRTKLRKDSKAFVCETLSVDLRNCLQELGLTRECSVLVPETPVSDLDPVVIYVNYNSVLADKQEYIPERVKIEISCRSLIEPFEKIAMRSMIEDAFPEEDFSWNLFDVPTVLPERTFLEKVFLLHEEFNRPNGCSRLDRLTRHIYDVVQMMDKDFAHNVMNNKKMYNDIVAHRKSFTAWSGMDYGTHMPSTISFVPPERISEELNADYIKMQNGFIYGDTLPYAELISRLKELQQRFRDLNW